MDTFKKLQILAAFAKETELDYLLEKTGEKGNPFDMLMIPQFQHAMDGSGKPMALCMYFANAKHAYTEQMQFELFHMMGYIERIANKKNLRELRTFLGEVNFQMPVGAYDVDAEGTVFLRYTLPIPYEMSDEMFLRQTSTAFALINTFALVFLPSIYAVIRGEHTAKTAMDLAREQLDDVYAVLRQTGEN